MIQEPTELELESATRWMEMFPGEEYQKCVERDEDIRDIQILQISSLNIVRRIKNRCEEKTRECDTYRRELEQRTNQCCRLTKCLKAAREQIKKLKEMLPSETGNQNCKRCTELTKEMTDNQEKLNDLNTCIQGALQIIQNYKINKSQDLDRNKDNTNLILQLQLILENNHKEDQEMSANIEVENRSITLSIDSTGSPSPITKKSPNVIHREMALKRALENALESQKKFEKDSLSLTFFPCDQGTIQEVSRKSADHFPVKRKIPNILCHSTKKLNTCGTMFKKVDNTKIVSPENVSVSDNTHSKKNDGKEIDRPESPVLTSELKKLSKKDSPEQCASSQSNSSPSVLKEKLTFTDDDIIKKPVYWKLKTSYSIENTEHKLSSLKQTKLSLQTLEKKIDIGDFTKFNLGVCHTSTQVSRKSMSENDIIGASPPNVKHIGKIMKESRLKKIKGTKNTEGKQHTSEHEQRDEMCSSSDDRNISSGAGPSEHQSYSWNKTCSTREERQISNEIICKMEEDKKQSLTRCTAEMSNSQSYKFREEGIRKKSIRKNLRGWECHMCQEYFRDEDQEALKEHLDRCSKHRACDPLIGLTPPGFWDPDFPDTDRP